jgi:hypothetical protein
VGLPRHAGSPPVIVFPDERPLNRLTDVAGRCMFKLASYQQYTPHVYSRDSSVGIALGYGLDDRGSRVRFPAGGWNFSLHHRVQNGSEAHPASYPMGTMGYFPGDKAAGA